MKSLFSLAVGVAVSLGLTLSAAAQSMPAHMEGMTHAAAPAAERVSGSGVVRAINAKDRTVTITHEPIAALNWPAMTMPLEARTPALLGQVKVGQAAHFTLEMEAAGPVLVALKAK